MPPNNELGTPRLFTALDQAEHIAEMEVEVDLPHPFTNVEIARAINACSSCGSSPYKIPRPDYVDNI